MLFSYDCNAIMIWLENTSDMKEPLILSVEVFFSDNIKGSFF